ncbi:unnamed protein product [Rotaria socialis]
MNSKHLASVLFVIMLLLTVGAQNQISSDSKSESNELISASKPEKDSSSIVSSVSEEEYVNDNQQFLSEWLT